MRIKSIKARQIINSKGHPALEVECSTGKNTAISSVPIASSKSKYEFFDVYDNNLSRFDGESLDIIVSNIENFIAPELVGKNSMDQESLDKLLIDLDGTVERTKLGVNTITAISQSIAKLGALESDLPLFKYIRVLHDFTGHPTERLSSVYKLPIPVITIMRSEDEALHGSIPAQEIMVIPSKFSSYKDQILKIYESIYSLRVEHKNSTLFEVLNMINNDLNKKAEDLRIGLDMSSSKYYRPEHKEYVIPNFHSTKTLQKATGKKLIKNYIEVLHKSNVVFIEDPFAEDDYISWKEFTDEVDSKMHWVQIVSDDLSATNLERLDKIGSLESCNNVAIKPSQVGTVTESIRFAQRAKKYGLNYTVSYRHGETEDQFISDFAVGVNADYIRTGFRKGTEYNCKVNRLLQIEDSI